MNVYTFDTGNLPLVVHVIPLYGVGGAANTSTMLAARHNPKRFRVAVLALKMTCSDADYEQHASRYLARIKRRQIPCFTIEGFNSNRYPRNCYTMLPFVARFGRTLRRLKPDIVVLHGFPGRFVGAATAKYACADSAVVLVVRDEIPHARFRVLRWTARRLTTALVDCFVAVSESVAESIRKEMRPPDGKIRVIHNGWDLSEYFPSERAEPVSKHFNIVCVARLVPKKDHVTLFRALQIISDQGDSVSKCFLVGDGPCRAQLEQLACELKIQEKVCFLGNVDNVPEILRTAHACVLLTEREGLPGALAEAMAVGLPVIATGIGPVLEMITDRVNGLVVPPRDPRAVADALYWIRTHWNDAKRLGCAARERALSFDVSNTVQGYEMLFERLLAEKRRT